MVAWSPYQQATLAGSPSDNPVYLGASPKPRCCGVGAETISYSWPTYLDDLDTLPDSYPPSPEDEHILALQGGQPPEAGSPDLDDADELQEGQQNVLGGKRCAQGHPKDMREKNKLAQRRYRAKRKEQQIANKKEVQELEAKLTELTMHNSDLQRRQRRMQAITHLQEQHINIMQHCQVVREVEADILLEELTRLMSHVERRVVPAAEAKAWTMEQWVTTHFQSYIERLKELLPAAQADPRCPSAQELVKLVTMRRETDMRSAMFSSLYWIIWAWNVHKTPQDAAGDLARSEPCHLLVGLNLTPRQAEDMLGARATLLFKLAEVAQQRKAALSALGFEMLHQPNKAALMRCQAAEDLHASLEAERDVVHTFLYSVTEEILTPLQEAWLDSQLHPWFPDVWQLCNLLARQHGLPEAPDFPELETGPQDFMPAAPPYHILKTPIVAYGIGLRLKRSVLEWHFLTTHKVSPISGLVYELPDLQHMKGMTLYEAQMGTYRRFWKRDDYITPEGGELPAYLADSCTSRTRASSPPSASITPCF